MLVLVLPAGVALGGAVTGRDKKLLKKTEKLFRVLDEAGAFASAKPDDGARYKSFVKKHASSFREAVEKLPESSLKSDLATAFHFHSLAASLPSDETGGTVAAPSSACAHERPGAYRNLCAESQGSRRGVALAKARLHAKWAKAAISLLRGEGDDAVREVLREREAEREIEARVARGALASLRALELDVRVYESFGEFVAGRAAVANVSHERFTERLRGASAAVGRDLEQLPVGRLRSLLRNSLQSYLDGHYRWAQSQQPLLVINAAAYNLSAQIPPRTARCSDPQSAQYTVVINWRHARRYAARAEEILGASR